MVLIGKVWGRSYSVAWDFERRSCTQLYSWLCRKGGDVSFACVSGESHFIESHPSGAWVCLTFGIAPNISSLAAAIKIEIQY